MSVSWTFDKGAGRRTIPIPRRVYLCAPSHLRSWRAIGRFRGIATSQPFRDWWMQECGGDGRVLKRFMLRFPAGAWDIPWELLVGEIDKERRPAISIVRGLAQEPGTLPSRFDRSMSMLLIKGDDGSKSGWGELNLDRETALLLDAYDQLPESHRAAMSKPRVIQPTESELRTLFQDPQSVPDVIFLSGHGSNRPPAFILTDGSSLTPKSFASIISATAVRPMFIVFWACDTAREENDGRNSPSPPFFSALLKCGVSSVLAMQAPVYDQAAILLAQELFQSLAGGDALDAAAARARATLLDALDTGAEGVSNVDWACPVVWSSGLSAARLGWRSEASKLAHMQTASRRARLDREGRPFFPPTQDEINEASRFSTLSPCWIRAGKLAEHRERWIRLLLAIQSVVPQYTVAVELNDTASAEDGLREWAEELQQTLEPSEASVEFRGTLELIRKRPEVGWKKLCSLQDTIMSIWNPPPYATGNWFWGPLRATAGVVLIAAATVPVSIVADGWSIEELDMQYDQATLDAARMEAPEIADALALLNEPVPRASIAATGASLNGAPGLEAFVISTQANEVMLSASAARYFRDRMTDDEKQQGHKTCMNILGHLSFAARLTPTIREQRLLHCLSAKEDAAAAQEASALLVRYRELDRQRAALSVIQRIRHLWRDLPPHLLIVAAWASAMLGEMQQAEFWLTRSSANDAFDEAWQFGLRSELDKARGDRDAALQSIDQAIATLGAAPAGDPNIERRQRAYRQDRARILQYLFYDSVAAAEEYEKLLDEWVGAEDATIDVATVLRNYAECVRTGHHPGDTEWERSKELLERATVLLENNTDCSVFAEITYEQARVALAEASPHAQDLLKAARDAAKKSGHIMLLAIVDARIFWQFEPFSIARWMDLDVNLTAFPRHGWAVRTLIDGRLRAAKRVQDQYVAIDLIESTRKAINENPAFTAGSDRFRIAATAAGHDIIAVGATPRWPDFLVLPWAADWVRENRLQNAPDVWGRVP